MAKIYSDKIIDQIGKDIAYIVKSSENTFDIDELRSMISDIYDIVLPLSDEWCDLDDFIVDLIGETTIHVNSENVKELYGIV